MKPLTFFDAAVALVGNVTEGWTWKTVLSGILLAVFGPITPIHVSFLILLILDLITGIAASRKEGTYSSHTGKVKSITKLSGYAVALILAYQLEVSIKATPFQAGADYTVGIFLLYLVFTEAKSIVENLRRLGMQVVLFPNPQQAFDELKEASSGTKDTGTKKGAQDTDEQDQPGA
ncbi:phage holin family protein [Deinococcus cellulosilyticus]|uniref:Holin n=1 Tax=Deinococcus cellulosilyticus (strain DSM 18568 / NBRC 106333 / KACC 11606 / 5516J-15) TaxID=1223518 RepID=A0A511N749_DEIC1|nr:phage holin family protein [Deinococcus cellulosilyticus]GEM48665.1 hypothetical protein DC3_43000 [Deinococcus cellulosilyticus NBRC 106333 = KACC 11606]